MGTEDVQLKVTQDDYLVLLQALGSADFHATWGMKSALERGDKERIEQLEQDAKPYSDLLEKLVKQVYQQPPDVAANLYQRMQERFQDSSD